MIECRSTIEVKGISCMIRAIGQILDVEEHLSLTVRQYKLHMTKTYHEQHFLFPNSA